MKIGNKEFDTLNNTYVMGILNVTPDSFSDGGKFNEKAAALKQVEKMVKEGADIIDIGGESSRPGYEHISVEEEIERTAPIIEAIKKEIDIPISIDTYHAKCALAAVRAGADMINDIWGLRHERETDMAKVVADTNAAVCIMHNRSVAEYPEGFLNGVKADLRESVDIAMKAGILPEKIVLDPGIGFAKSFEENLLMLKHMSELHEFGLPLLLGTSRKSVIGNALSLPINEREEGTITTSVLAAVNHYAFVRVHDVEKNVRALKMYYAIINA